MIGARRRGAGIVALAFSCGLLATPANAHHAIGGATPSNAWEGFLSGLAHPVLGLDHLAFLVAAGLLAAIYRRGAFIPVAFVAASLAGAALQSLTWVLPAPEWMVSVSVLLFGALLVARPRNVPVVVSLASAAGILHGYAFGQTIVGAGMTSLSAYLVGLALVQTAICLAIRGVAQRAFRPTPGMEFLTLRWAGLVVFGIGLGHLAQWLG